MAKKIWCVFYALVYIGQPLFVTSIANRVHVSATCVRYSKVNAGFAVHVSTF